MRGAIMSKFDIHQLIEKKRHRKKELLKLMSEENVLLSLISKPESYPDFAGQFLNNVGEALFNAMCENDSEMVETLVQRYFYGCLLQYDKLCPDELDKGMQSLNNLKIATAPLLDIMNLSGYAFLFSEYHDEPSLKQPIEQTWNTYLNEEVESQRLQSLAASVSLSESGIEIEHRSLLRTRWKQIVQKFLSDVEREEVPINYNSVVISAFLVERETFPKHKSPLVRVLARHPDYLFYDGIDIFIAKYVHFREGEEKLDFGWKRRRDLAEQIKREEIDISWMNNREK